MSPKINPHSVLTLRMFIRRQHSQANKPFTSLSSFPSYPTSQWTQKTLKKQTPGWKSYQETLWHLRSLQKHLLPGKTSCVHLWFSWLKIEIWWCSCHLRQNNCPDPLWCGHPSSRLRAVVCNLVNTAGLYNQRKPGEVPPTPPDLSLLLRNWVNG